MRKSNLDKHRDSTATPETKRVETDLDGLLQILTGGPLNPTQRSFIYDADRIKAYMGPAGCAKTSTLCAAGLARSLLQPGSKGFISRNDYNDMVDTDILRMSEMLGRLPKGILLDRDKSPPMKWWIRPVTGLENAEPSQITFMGLKDDIVGVEANWWVVDEANEVVEQRLHQINARMRAKGGNYAVMMAFNPPDKHHWLYTACTGRDFQDKPAGKPAWVKLYRPNPKENVQNLPDKYYESLAETLPEDQKQRFVDGEWGSTFEGQPVYREFKFDWHVRDILYDPNLPLFRFWDFGYNRPFCGWAQIDFNGRLLVLAESLGNKIEIRPWAERCKALTATHFPDPANIIDFGDPAVRQKKDTGSALVHLNQAGIQMRFRTDVPFDEGIRLLRQRLTTTIDGEPAIQFNRRTCPILAAALRGGYHLDKEGDKPVKDGYYDHGMDALRYMIMNLFHGSGESGRHFGVSKIPSSIEYNGQ